MRIIGFVDYLEDSGGVKFLIEVDGVEYQVECWSTRHGAGVDVYDDNGNDVTMDVLPDEDANDRFDELRSAFENAYYTDPRQEQIAALESAIIADAITTAHRWSES